MGNRVSLSGSILFAVLLVAAGVLLLLNTLDLVDWSVWRGVGRFWPVFLIGGGIVLLIRHLKGD